MPWYTSAIAPRAMSAKPATVAIFIRITSLRTLSGQAAGVCAIERTGWVCNPAQRLRARGRILDRAHISTILFVLAGEVAMLSNSTTSKNVDEAASEQSWAGFMCRDCGAPLAVHRSNNRSRAGERSTRGWRITCISCGVPDFYELGTQMVRIVAT